jgi:hypothetical protein
MQFHLTSKSSNKKLGGLPASTSSKETCPTSCGLFNQCYAKKGPQSWHWAKVTKKERGTDWPGFLSQVEKLKPGSLFRHNVSGDLPTITGLIDTVKLDQLQCATVNAGVNLYTYTHWHTDPNKGQANLDTVKRFSGPGFVINISTEKIEDACKYKRQGLDVVITDSTVFELAVRAIKDNRRSLFVADSQDLNNPLKVIPCPEQYTESATCATCKLCARANRNYVIAFKEH